MALSSPAKPPASPSAAQAEEAAAPRPSGAKLDAAALRDDLNRSIIEILRRDGRSSFAEMAAALDVSEGTIRNRINALKQSGMLRIVALVDPSVVEYETEAMLGIKVAGGHTPQRLASRLNECSEVIFILWVSGRYDLLVEIVANDREHFLAFLDKHVYGHDDIASVEVMTGLKNFKNQFLLKRNWS